MLISFLSVFYIFLATIFLVLFFYEMKDIWFKTFYFIGFIIVIVLMIHLAFFQTNIDNDYQTDTDYIVLDDMDINNLIAAGSETYTSSTIFFVHSFPNVEHDKIGNYKNAEFCFYYNNSDANPNVVRVTNDVNAISRYIYLLNGTYGMKCASINASIVGAGTLFGLNCLDCSPVNPLNIPKYFTSEKVEEIHITKTDPTSYTMESENAAHGFWIEAHITPKEQINDNLWLMLTSLFVFSLMFIFRIFYKMINEGMDFE